MCTLVKTYGMDIKADTLNDIKAELDLLESSPVTGLVTSKQRLKEFKTSQLPVTVKATQLKFDGSLSTTLKHKEWRPKPLGSRSSTAMGDYEMPERRRSLPGLSLRSGHSFLCMCMPRWGIVTGMTADNRALCTAVRPKDVPCSSASEQRLSRSPNIAPFVAHDSRRTIAGTGEVVHVSLPMPSGAAVLPSPACNLLTLTHLKISGTDLKRQGLYFEEQRPSWKHTRASISSTFFLNQPFSGDRD